MTDTIRRRELAPGTVRSLCVSGESGGERAKRLSQMIDRMRELSESVEYWSLSANLAKGTAEIKFLRPGQAFQRVFMFSRRDFR